MMGILGTVVGASAVGMVGAARSIAQMYYPGMAANNEHRHQLLATVQQQRADTVQRWRAGLAGARDSYRQWAAGPRDGDPPNAVGDEWFEGLRPHLSSSDAGAQFRTAQDVNCDNATVVLLSLEIGRVEHEWMDEAQAGPRRARNRRG